MTAAATKTEQWGKHLGVRLPASVASAAGLKVGQRMRITVEDGRVILTPVVKQPLTLDERLARFDLALHGGEAMAGTSSR